MATPTSLAQGTKYDEEKIRLDLFSPQVYSAISEVLTKGAIKYEDHNWAKGILYSRVVAALERHINAFKSGENLDPEWGLHHLAHAGCCIMFLLHYELMCPQYSAFDDRPSWDDMVQT